MKLENAKGMKDFLPQEEIVRQDIIDSLRGIFELYGFSPMDTPGIEKFDVLSSKYAGGEEILKETFKLKDQGKRDLGLRYDLTVPFARVIGMNPNMKMPFKRYQIGKVWRDGPIGMARYREFIQCDVDVVGANSMSYDAELILLAERFFKKLGLETKVRVNNRKILNDLLEKIGIQKSKREGVILSIDKLDKFGEKEVIAELKKKGIKKDIIKDLLSIIIPASSNSETLKGLKMIMPESKGLEEIRQVLKICPKTVFDVSLARGLTYYTGTIIEIFLKDSKIRSAVCAGGRYDDLIGKSLGRGDFPAVGISFGLSRIFDAVKKTDRKTVTDILIIPINTKEKSLKIAEKLRDNGIKAEIDLSDRGPSKNMKYADSQGIPFVGFIGDDELKKGVIKIKDMGSGKESEVKIDKVPDFIQ